MACRGYSLSVSKQSLAGWGAGGGLLPLSGQSEAAGVFGQVELRRYGAGRICACVRGGVLVRKRDVECGCACVCVI